MANYRRNFLAGGSYFFTINLADRRLTLLNDHIDLLRAAFRHVRFLRRVEQARKSLRAGRGVKIENLK